MTISDETRADIRREMAGLKGRQARERADALAARTGLTRKRIYELTRDVRPARKARTDKGVDRLGLDREQWDFMLGAITRYGYGAEDAVMFAIANGRVSREEAPAPGTLSRKLRDEGVTAKNLKTKRGICRRFQAPHPNALHQADATIAQQFYLAADGSIATERVLPNRPTNGRPRLVLYGLVDDYSRAGYARFYTGGECAIDWMDFLYHAWRAKADPAANPFRGLPGTLYSDNGSGLRSARAARALAFLGVEAKFHQPHHPQAKGKIEKFLQTIQTKFERGTKFEKVASVDEANAALDDWLVWWGRREHRSTEEAPFARWWKGAVDLRDVPDADLYRALAHERITRQLSVHMEISVAGRRYSLAHVRELRDLAAGSRVEVLYCRERPEELFVVAAGAEYGAKLIEGNAADFEHPELPAAREALTPANAALARLAAVDYSGVRASGYFTELSADMRFPQRAEVAKFRPAEPVRPRPISRFAATLLLQRDGVVSEPPGAADGALLEVLFAGADLVDERAVSDLVRSLDGRAGAEALAWIDAKLSGGRSAAQAG